jgi:hypothetical protein
MFAWSDCCHFATGVPAMRLIRVRFTIRRLMVAVAIVGMVLGTVEGLRRRRELFEQRAGMFAQKVSDEITAEQNYRMARRGNRPGSAFYYDGRTTTAHYELVDHYSALREKYDQAAARPWLVVAPDPPEPTWPKNVPRDPPWTKEDADRLPMRHNR